MATNNSLKQTLFLIKKRKISIKELVLDYIKKIKKLNKEYNVFLEVFEKQAIAQAQKKDKELKKFRNLPPLYGIPVAIKDNILVKGHKTTAGSLILKDFVAPYDATAVKKLKQAGAIIIGKTNLDEFAMGSSTENSAFFATKNPYDKKRVPGGSSGGSAVAVSLDMAPVALGSDTGGSIRQPASFCGVYGLKPTYGAVSRFGLIAMASSFDVIGPFAKNLDDLFLVFDIIKGKDEFDLTSYYPRNLDISKSRNLDISTYRNIDISTYRHIEISKYRHIDIPTYRVCYLKEYFEGCNPKIKQKILKLLGNLEKKFKKIKVTQESLPIIKYSLPCYYIIMPSEVSSNLARYDGVKYGAEISQKTPKTIWDYYMDVRGKYFGDEPKRRIFMGNFALSYGYYEAYYGKANLVRRKIKSQIQTLFKKYDFIIGPTSPEPPFKIGEKLKDPIKMYLSDIYTVPANIGGFPAISIPCGFVGNLPVGIQVMADLWQEKKLYNFSKILEKII